MESELTALDTQIQYLEDQANTLTSIDNTAKSIEEALREAEIARVEAFKDGATQTVEGFASLDKNVDGLLTFDELKVSGMASDSTLEELYRLMDTNGDGTVSMLEAINQASEGTYYSMLHVESLIASLNNNQITITQFKELIQVLAAANSSVGAPNNGIPAGITDVVNQSPLGATIVDNTLYSKAGEAKINVPDALGYIQSYIGAINSGTSGFTKESLYNILVKDWGISSSMLASMAGLDKSTVLAYFEGMPAFAVGTNFVPEDMPAIVHKGERIIPAADNEKIMSALNKNTNNDDLVKEIKELMLSTLMNLSILIENKLLIRKNIADKLALY
jgi:Ca2+-binding EF-hand superfamily protein